MRFSSSSECCLEAAIGLAAACALLAGAPKAARALAAPLSSAPARTSTTWHYSLGWRGQEARVSVRLDGKYLLRAPAGERLITAQRWRVQTASPLFDALFAMAQQDLAGDSVSAITDAAFDHGRPIPCRCFIAGEEWPFVWTRDVSYSIDLGLWRLGPGRARASLLFKISPPRAAAPRHDLFVMQDTGSGGSWPISTDRVVWFLGARHLLSDPAFADTVYRTLLDTLAQDRRYVFDPWLGLYRGETSFLDWREQTYPAWTAHDVVFIAQSFALSTNVLHYEALQLAAEMAKQRGHRTVAARYAREARDLKKAIDTRFWRPDRGLYMSYIGGPVDPAPFDAYDLLGLDLAITSGVADPERARESLEHYPAWPAGSPVIWPERRDQPIYHNRAIWPFVSDYTLRAARRLGDPALIALEVRSLMRGAALNASNMENYSLLAQSTHVPGPLGGPVVDSPRQLWSVAGYLDMVLRGVFGVEDDGRVAPELPSTLVPMLFGSRRQISLYLDGRRVVLDRPASLDGALLVAGAIQQHGGTSEVELMATPPRAAPPRMNAPLYLAPLPATAPPLSASGVGTPVGIGGRWPRHWTAAGSGEYLAWLHYSNSHGPINTGITAAVRRLEIRCADSPRQVMPVVMPQSERWQASTTVRFHAHADAACTFSLLQGFNMSDLAQFAHYTGPPPAPPAKASHATGSRQAARPSPPRPKPAHPKPVLNGGATGPLDSARIGALMIAPIGRHTRPRTAVASPRNSSDSGHGSHCIRGRCRRALLRDVVDRAHHARIRARASAGLHTQGAGRPAHGCLQSLAARSRHVGSGSR
ncbi:MAG: Six-hairpin glycosidase-like protein [Steroidobacteraceae bacterium]